MRDATVLVSHEPTDIGNYDKHVSHKVHIIIYYTVVDPESGEVACENREIPGGGHCPLKNPREGRGNTSLYPSWICF